MDEEVLKNRKNFVENHLFLLLSAAVSGIERLEYIETLGNEYVFIHLKGGYITTVNIQYDSKLEIACDVIQVLKKWEGYR